MYMVETFGLPIWRTKITYCQGECMDYKN